MTCQLVNRKHVGDMRTNGHWPKGKGVPLSFAKKLKLNIIIIMEKEFIRTRSVLDILVSLAFVSLGTILTFYPLGKMSGAIGIVCLIVGFLSLLLLKTTYKDEMGEEGYIKKTFCFPNDMKEDILAAMRNGSIENIGNIHSECNSQSILLCAYCHKKSDKVFLRLYEYVPYSYVPCTDFCKVSYGELKEMLG